MAKDRKNPITTETMLIIHDTTNPKALECLERKMIKQMDEVEKMTATME